MARDKEENTILENLGNFGDFLGGIAVVATLIYLALQVRQNTSLIRATALSNTSSSMSGFNYLLGSDPTVAKVFQVGIEDFASLSDEERRQFINLLRASFTGHEEVFLHYQQGMIDRNIWERNRDIAGALLSRPHIETWWLNRKHIYAAEFVRVMDESPRFDNQVFAAEVIDRMLEAC